MKRKTPSVIVGIAAYNSEKNIKRLLKALLTQSQRGFLLKRIVVYSDKSVDKTVAKAREIKSPVLKVIDAKTNRGFGYVVKYLLSTSGADITILLNDDIYINDKYLIEKLVVPFSDEKVGLVSGNPQSLNRDNFVERACYSSFKAYETMRLRINNGHNIFTCDGKVMAFSKKFIASIRFPQKEYMMGCVDIFMYFSCIRSQFIYRNVPDAVVFGKNPSTIGDYIALITRINSISPIRKRFGKIVDSELKKPLGLYLFATCKEFLKNPLGGMFILSTSFYIRLKMLFGSKSFNPTWKPVRSTKFSLFSLISL